VKARGTVQAREWDIRRKDSIRNCGSIKAQTRTQCLNDRFLNQLSFRQPFLSDCNQFGASSSR